MNEVIEEQIQRLNESLYAYDPRTDEEVNIPEALIGLTASMNRIASSILPQDASPGTDASGGHVTSLTEAVMGMTSGLCRIASALESLADAIDRKD